MKASSYAVPVGITGLKFIQLATPVPRLSVIMFWEALSASTQVCRLIWHSIAVHLPPEKQPQSINQMATHSNSSLNLSYIFKAWALVSLRLRWLKWNKDNYCSYLTLFVSGKCLSWDVWTSQFRVFHISISSWICSGSTKVSWLQTVQTHKHTFSHSHSECRFRSPNRHSGTVLQYLERL